MNLITIVLCVLMMEVTVIIAKTQKLQATLNPQKLLLATPPTFTSPTTPPLPLRYSGPSKSLYSYNYNTDTGIQIQEEGHLNNVGTDQETLEARGSYGYTDTEGNTFQVSYVANENGFQPEGAHLPTVPPLIKKALQYIAEHPEENGEK